LCYNINIHFKEEGKMKFKMRKGQNTVEYLLMLAVVVGVVLIAGMAIKKYMPDLWTQIQGMISGAAGNLGSSAGNQ
jgi:Flp pilus assembly pilin Flp